MKNEVIKTVLHLTDDKGWTKEQELEGDWHGRMWIVRKYARKDATVPLTKMCYEPPAECLIRDDIEFEAHRTSYEKIAWHCYLKHVYLEQKIS